MKLWSPFLILFTIASGVLAARPSADRFEKFQSLSRSGPVDLDSSSFKELTTTPRDYYAVVILTAMDARYGCVMCREFGPEWDMINRSWNKGTKLDGLKVVFGTLDFDRGKEVFQKVLRALDLDPSRISLTDLFISFCFRLHPLSSCSLPLLGLSLR